jgi:putative transposase
MKTRYRSNNNIVFCCNYHVVFCPKYRRAVLVGPVEKRLKAITREICFERDSELVEIECDGNHVPMILSVDPQFGIHRLIKQIKGRSSHHLRDEFAHLKSSLPSLWTNSYFVSTIGGVTLDVVKKYVENQKLRGEPRKL